MTAPIYRFQIYRDVAGGWRWRLRSRNSRIVADSGEAYKTRRSVERAVSSLCAARFAVEVQ